MDAVFAILVLGAVIFFGALISAGNERQRKALEGIREQAAQWAMQDLRLKREKLAREVKVDDPVVWLNQVVTKAVGENLELALTEIFEGPQTLACTTKDGRRVLISPESLGDVQKLNLAKKNKLFRLGNAHPLRLISVGQAVELSLLNAGVFFDLELKIAWVQMTGKPINADRIWLYL